MSRGFGNDQNGAARFGESGEVVVVLILAEAVYRVRTFGFDTGEYEKYTIVAGQFR